MGDRLAEIEARLSKSEPGPWLTDTTQNDDPVVYVRIPGGASVLFEADWGTDADADLIAAAPTDLRDLLAVAKAARPFTTCPLYGHFHHRMGGVTDYTEQRRIDCADDQCSNPDCVKWVDCTHPSHVLRAALANLEGGA